jgi:hypothetical protein
MKLDTGEQPIERGGANNEGHAGGDCLVLDRSELHFQPLAFLGLNFGQLLSGLFVGKSFGRSG